MNENLVNQGIEYLKQGSAALEAAIMNGLRNELKEEDVELVAMKIVDMLRNNDAKGGVTSVSGGGVVRIGERVENTDIVLEFKLNIDKQLRTICPVIDRYPVARDDYPAAVRARLEDKSASFKQTSAGFRVSTLFEALVFVEDELSKMANGLAAGAGIDVARYLINDCSMLKAELGVIQIYAYADDNNDIAFYYELDNSITLMAKQDLRF